MSKLKQPLKIYQLFLIGIGVCLLSTYVAVPLMGPLGGIFVFVGFFIILVAIVKSIAKLFRAIMK
jgi:hypothetical protein